MSAGLNKEKESRSLELSEQQVHKQQHQPPSETQGVGVSAENDWIISIESVSWLTERNLDLALQDLDACSWSKRTIYKVPRHLREGDDKAYVPQILSLGPYHHNKEHLRQMDRHKWRFLQLVLKRNNHKIEDYVDSIKELEGKARDCYEGRINMSSNKFLLMMVLDGCFVLELFRGAAEGFEQLSNGTNHPVFAMRGSISLIPRDMIMLENQIPLVILDRLLGLQLGYPNQKGLVATLTVRFFNLSMPMPFTKSDWNKLESSVHCLDVVRQSLLCTRERNKSESSIHWLDVVRRSLLCTCDGPVTKISDKNKLQGIHCVTELRDAGIKFKKGETNQLLDIKFNKINGVLEIPTLLIDDDTKSRFLNLIAFEQCHVDGTNVTCSYVLVMDNLINSSEDVRHLHDCGIIEHLLGSDGKVADLINCLCQEVAVDINDSYFTGLSQDINDYCKQRWPAWRAALKQKYFSNPWAIISVIAGVVLLLLTLTQTFYAVYGYHRPS